MLLRLLLVEVGQYRHRKLERQQRLRIITTKTTILQIFSDRIHIRIVNFLLGLQDSFLADVFVVVEQLMNGYSIHSALIYNINFTYCCGTLWSRPTLSLKAFFTLHHICRSCVNEIRALCCAIAHFCSNKIRGHCYATMCSNK